MEATAWIALVALAFTGTQAWTARRKLQFDLFSKRFEAWDAFNVALNGRREEIQKGAAAGDVSAEDKCLKEMWRQKQLIRVLYPPEVTKAVEAIEAKVLAFSIQCVAVREREPIPSPEAGQRAAARFQAFTEADRELWTAQEVLMVLVHPYVQQYGWWELHAVPAGRRLWRRGQSAFRSTAEKLNRPRHEEPS